MWYPWCVCLCVCETCGGCCCTKRRQFQGLLSGGKEAINLCLQNGIQLSFKASRIFLEMISLCLLIFPCGHIDSAVCECVCVYAVIHICWAMFKAGFMMKPLFLIRHAWEPQSLLFFNYSQFPSGSSIWGAISWTGCLIRTKLCWHLILFVCFLLSGQSQNSSQCLDEVYNKHGARKDVDQ